MGDSSSKASSGSSSSKSSSASSSGSAQSTNTLKVGNIEFENMCDSLGYKNCQFEGGENFHYKAKSKDACGALCAKDKGCLGIDWSSPKCYTIPIEQASGEVVANGSYTAFKKIIPWDARYYTKWKQATFTDGPNNSLIGGPFLKKGKYKKGVYYYNTKNETSWKMPRRELSTPKAVKNSSQSSSQSSSKSSLKSSSKSSSKRSSQSSSKSSSQSDSNQSNNDDWKEMKDKTGQKYYWNTKTNQTAWKIPAKQSNNDDWKEMNDQYGKTYYWNKKTNQTAWKIPAKQNTGYQSSRNSYIHSIHTQQKLLFNPDDLNTHPVDQMTDAELNMMENEFPRTTTMTRYAGPYYLHAYTPANALENSEPVRDYTFQGMIESADPQTFVVVIIITAVSTAIAKWFCCPSRRLLNATAVLSPPKTPAQNLTTTN